MCAVPRDNSVASEDYTGIEKKFFGDMQKRQHVTVYYLFMVFQAYVYGNLGISEKLRIRILLRSECNID